MFFGCGVYISYNRFLPHPHTHFTLLSCQLSFYMCEISKQFKIVILAASVYLHIYIWMNNIVLFTFISITISSSPTCSEPADPKCEDLDPETYRVPEGEAFYFVPDELDRDISDERVTWYKNEIENITTDEDKSVHYHRGALFFLNLVTEDSGSYTTR